MNRDIQRVKNYVTSTNFYFSTWIDLTRSFQKQSHQYEEDGYAFFANRYGLNFVDVDNMAGLLTVKCIEGYIGSLELSLLIRPILELFGKSHPNGDVDDVRIILRSAKNINRSGTRFMARGVDSNGQVANFYESEQIFIYQLTLASLVLIRGSVPIFWQQMLHLSTGL